MSASLLKAIADSSHDARGHLEAQTIDPKFANQARAVLDALQSLRDESNRLAVTTPQKLHDVGDLLSHASNAEAAANLLSAAMSNTPSPTATSAVQNAANWVKNTLLPWIQKIVQSVWTVIQSLSTPKAWKLSGGISSGFLGLANAEIEIEFG